MEEGNHICEECRNYGCLTIASIEHGFTEVECDDWQCSLFQHRLNNYEKITKCSHFQQKDKDNKSSTCIPHKCPVCNGTGKVSIPPQVAGDRNEWAGSSDAAISFQCSACIGAGIVWSARSCPLK